MKNTTLSFLLLLITCYSHAQITSPSNFQWVKGGGSASNGNTTSEAIQYMDVDKNGNVYAMATVEGYNGSNIKIDTFQKMNGYGYDDFVVFSYNCSGKLRWVKYFGGGVIDKPGGLTVDDSGNVYVCGVVPVSQTSPSLYGDTTIPATPGYMQDLFVMKMDSLGNRKWFKMMGYGQPNAIWALPRGLALDAQGTLHMFTWFFTLGAVWDGHSPTQKSWNVVKLNSSNGMVTGMTKLQLGDKANPSSVYTRSFVKDSANNYYLTTSFGGGDTVVLNGSQIILDTFNQIGIIAKFSSSGNLLWHHVSRIKFSSSVGSLTLLQNVVHNGAVYLGIGLRGDSANFFGLTITNNLSSNPYNDPGVVKLDAATGQGIWGNVVKVHQVATAGVPVVLQNGTIGFQGAGGLICVINANDTIKPTHAMGNMSPFVTVLNHQTGQFISGEAVPALGAGHTITAAISDGTPSGFYFAGGFTQKLYTDNKADSLVSNGGHNDFFIYRYAMSNSCNCPPVAPKAQPQMVGLQFNVLTVKTTPVTGADSLVWQWGNGKTTKDLNPGSNVSHTYTTPGTYNVCLRTYAPCSVEDSCFSIVVTSVKDTELPLLTVYPNPATDFLTIENPYAQKAQVLLTDIKGATIITQPLNNPQSQIDISTLTPGMYMVFITLEDGRRTVRKVVKE
ncbi:MAG TPA: T9SS type A sorting domain-containing protein [Flavipsychrobacter sp.]|nr:T9SS type A sorting domain-containing protein [Flavipsychrobacter sp.]